MNLFKGLWACVKGILMLVRHGSQIPTDAQLRGLGIEPYHNDGVPLWAFRGIQQQHRHR